jgi:hypothetical protein
MPRICTICRHPARQDIEADLRAGIPYRDVARRRNVSNHALWRHRVKHVSLNTVTELATATKIRALLDQAATATTWSATLLTIRDARRYVEELMARLTAPSSRQT